MLVRSYHKHPRFSDIPIFVFAVFTSKFKQVFPLGKLSKGADEMANKAVPEGADPRGAV